jgi:sulfonate transport system ATP-binding protein
MALIEEQYDQDKNPLDKKQSLNSASIPILHVKDVCKTFPYYSRNPSKTAFERKTAQDVLHRVNLSVREGEFVTIVGRSGCGKTTLLNIIAGLDKPDSGNVMVKGSNNLSSARRIMVFQEGALFPWLSVYGNIKFGLRFANVSEERRSQIARNYMEMVGLTKFSESLIYQLSGGMKQKVAIARALAMEPEILLMDEPFAALDIHTRELLHDELVGIHKTTGKTILFVTHDIHEAILLGDRVIVMSASLKNIQKEFLIELPRPRDPENQSLLWIKRQILNECEGDLQLAKRRG